MPIIEIAKTSSNQQIEALILLLTEQMKAIGRKRDPVQIKDALTNAFKPESRARFFLCHEDDGEAVGCCVVNICSGIEAGGDYVWINEIHVREDRRGRGIGRKLLEYVVSWAEDNGYGYLASMSSPDNQVSQSLFSSHGFGLSRIIWMDKSL
jgi:GNAT superfamily N-acetyltransferase